MVEIDHGLKFLALHDAEVFHVVILVSELVAPLLVGHFEREGRGSFDLGKGPE